MARLPTPGGDNGNWGTILNDFLSQSLKTNGLIKDNAVTANTIAPNSVTSAALASNAVNATIIADGSITESLLDQALKDKVNALASGGVTSVAGKTGAVTLEKTDVGLSNVDNTSDATKNAATATLSNKTLDSPRINAINDTNGAPIISYITIPSAVNRFYITNQSAGNYPTFGVEGSDANIGLSVAPKGNGPFRIFANGGITPTLDVAGQDDNISLNIVTKGTGKLLSNNTPVVTSSMQNPLYTMPGRFEPWPQIMCAGGNWGLISGDMPMTFFTPATNMTVNNIITMGWNDTTQENATECRVGIYRVDDITTWPADMTCIARSAHKPDRWNGATVDTAPIVDDGAETPNPISSVQLTAGQQYAVAFLSVGHTGTPKLSALGGFRKNTFEPHVGFFAGGGYTNMSVHLTGGWVEEWTFVWFALT